MQNDQLVSRLRRAITDEIVAAFGFQRQGLARAWLGPLFWPPAQVFSSLVARIDRIVGENGLTAAANQLLPRFVDEMRVFGTEHIPMEGPLLVASNHPGAYDGVAVLASLPRRDIKIIVSDVKFFRSLPETSAHLIYTPPGAGARVSTVREILRHLKNGGSVLIFPSGHVDPDPDVLPGAQEGLRDWSHSLDLIMKRLPETQLLVSIVSGVLAPTCLRNPLTRLPKEAWRQQKLAEFLQVIEQLLFGRKFGLRPRLSFGRPVTAFDLSAEGAENLHDSILYWAGQVLQGHLQTGLV